MTAVSVSDAQKRARVVEKNTFYFFDAAAQDTNEGQIHSLREILTALKARVQCCNSEEEKGRHLTKCWRSAKTACAPCLR